MRVQDYFRRIGHKLNRHYPSLEKALEEHFKTLPSDQQRLIIHELNRLDCDIGNEISAARRRGEMGPWRR